MVSSSPKLLSEPIHNEEGVINAQPDSQKRDDIVCIDRDIIENVAKTSYYSHGCKDSVDSRKNWKAGRNQASEHQEQDDQCQRGR